MECPPSRVVPRLIGLLVEIPTLGVGSSSDSDRSDSDVSMVGVGSSSDSDVDVLNDLLLLCDFRVICVIQ